jgi:hypothetical protein
VEAMLGSLGSYGHIAFQDEGEAGKLSVNIGQMFIRCCENTYRFFTSVRDDFKATGEWEQGLINRRRSELSTALFPATFANTKTARHYSVEMLRELHSFHAICTAPKGDKTSVEQKLDIFEKLNAKLKIRENPVSNSIGPANIAPQHIHGNRPTSTGDNEAPYSVAIVAAGQSRNDYLSACINGSGRKRVADETWAVNMMANVIEHDRAIIMDAAPYFSKAARDCPALDGYRDWLHLHPGPIYTQRKYEGFPGTVEFPLEAVVNKLGCAYFNTTVAYAVALAIYIGVRHIKLYGIDFTYDGNRGFAEAGRACVEYWLRDAMWRKVKVEIAPSSTLMDHCTGRALYGYSTPPKLDWKDGRCTVTHPQTIGAIPV